MEKRLKISVFSFKLHGTNKVIHGKNSPPFGRARDGNMIYTQKTILLGDDVAIIIDLIEGKATEGVQK